jgi:CO dehydrogenase/acetyl-CoA synthase beta subunit
MGDQRYVIKGYRYKCMGCDNFDSCHVCLDSGKRAALTRAVAVGWWGPRET